LNMSPAGVERVVLLACGSFNPPTLLHLRLFEVARDYWRAKQEDRSQVVAGVISPTHDEYSKHKPSLLPGKHRLEMVARALQGSDWVRASDWELQQEGWSRTRATLDSLSSLANSPSRGQLSWLPPQLSPGTPLSLKLLCGADLLESFAVPNLWDKEDLVTIVRDYGIIVVSREGSNPEKFIYQSDLLTQYKNNIHIVTEWIANDVSSTKIRTAVRREQSIKYLVPDNVIQYIQENNLYKDI